MATNERLTARVAELEAKLGLPPKTPDNSSVPPSKGQKPSEPTAAKDKAKPHAGAHRPLHPNPTSKREVFACRRQGCGADVSGVAQSPCETYDRIENSAKVGYCGITRYRATRYGLTQTGLPPAATRQLSLRTRNSSQPKPPSITPSTSSATHTSARTHCTLRAAAMNTWREAVAAA